MKDKTNIREIKEILNKEYIREKDVEQLIKLLRKELLKETDKK